MIPTLLRAASIERPRTVCYCMSVLPSFRRARSRLLCLLRCWYTVCSTENGDWVMKLWAERTTTHINTLRSTHAVRVCILPVLTSLEPHSHIWGQNALIISSLSPKRDWGPKIIKKNKILIIDLFSFLLSFYLAVHIFWRDFCSSSFGQTVYGTSPGKTSPLGALPVGLPKPTHHSHPQQSPSRCLATAVPLHRARGLGTAAAIGK